MTESAKTELRSCKITDEKAQEVLEKLRFAHSGGPGDHSQNIWATAILDDDENLTAIELKGYLTDGYGRYAGNKETLDIKFPLDGKSIVLDGWIDRGVYQKKIRISPRHLLDVLDELGIEAEELGMCVLDFYKEICRRQPASNTVRRRTSHADGL